MPRKFPPSKLRKPPPQPKPIPKYRSRWENSQGQVPEGGGMYIPHAFRNFTQQKALNPTDILLLEELMRFRWDGNTYPFPSEGKLAKAIGTSRWSVIRALNKMEAMDLVVRVRKSKTCTFDLGPLLDQVVEYSREGKDEEKKSRKVL